jgi:Chaperone of endosialidase
MWRAQYSANKPKENRMSHRTILIALLTLGLIAGHASAQRTAPSALLTIDENRATVVDRIVGDWGGRLERSNAGINRTQLRQILSGLRADHLLAASLAGTVEGLRDVVAAAVVRADAAVSRTDAAAPSRRLHAESLGDTTDDLVYTPVTPCRIVDTRLTASGIFAPQTQRDWVAFSPGGFAAQGGSATNCGIPVRPVAVLMNTTLANTAGGPEFFVLWPFGQARPLAATVNWWAPAQQPANAEIVPMCTGAGCTSDFSAYSSGQTHAIIDVVGYLNRPTNYGGVHTITGVNATDSGGFQNTASGDVSTVGGGSGNEASGVASTIGGGQTNTASLIYSTVAGGAFNRSQGDSSAVGGGSSNFAIGSHSTIPGGLENIVAGDYSVASGRHARNLNTAHAGVFIFADSNALDFVSQAANEFAARAIGGVRFVTAIDGGGTPTWVCGVSGGAGGSWGCSSDRNVKTGLVSLDGVKTLERLAAMPVYRWFASDDARKIPHAGPMAQDFMAAFGLGDNDKMIGFADAQGIAFAAIQGLHWQLIQKTREIAALKARLTEVDGLKRKLKAIEAKLGM